MKRNRFKPVEVKKRGNRYQLYYYSPDGQRRRLSVGTDLQTAQRMAVQHNDLLMMGKDPEREMERISRSERGKLISLREFYSKFMDRYGKRQSEGQQLNYRSRFNNLCRCRQLADCPMSHINKGIVAEYLKLRRDHDKVTAGTANHDMNFINCMLNRAVEWDILDKNPLQGMKKFKTSGKRDVKVSTEQLGELLESLPSRLADMVEFAAYTGFRLGNILSLKIDQIRFHDLTSTGEVDLVVKGGRLETFPLSPPAVELLRKVIGERNSGFVFINPRTGTQFKRSGINAFYLHVRKIGLTAKDGSPFRFHDLRHVYATTARDLGISLDDLRLIMGHKDRATTDRYVTYDRKAVGEYLSDLPRLRK